MSCHVVEEHARVERRRLRLPAHLLRIARRVLGCGEADLGVQAADALNVRRALMLGAEIAAFQRPVILALGATAIFVKLSEG